jgi:hypothetical protein
MTGDSKGERATGGDAGDEAGDEATAENVQRSELQYPKK